jgi:Rrf2 family transcriptional regulator, iron-sulfur cluster assembly transcription factor
MMGFARATQDALSAMSLLAQVYDGGTTRLSAADIAARRHLQKAFLAKLLTAMAQARLITGAPGPGGGYALALHPRQISLQAIASVFERGDDSLTCPFGRDWCGNQQPCPLHQSMGDLKQHIQQFLRSTTLDIFLPAVPPSTPVDASEGAALLRTNVSQSSAARGS